MWAEFIQRTFKKARRDQKDNRGTQLQPCATWRWGGMSGKAFNLLIAQCPNSVYPFENKHVVLCVTPMCCSFLRMETRILWKGKLLTTSPAGTEKAYAHLPRSQISLMAGPFPSGDPCGLLGGRDRTPHILSPHKFSPLMFRLWD